MNYEWRIVKMLPLEHVWKNELPKRTIILEEITDKEWKGWLAIDFIKDKTELLNEVKEWDVVNCTLNFRVNEYNWRRYNGITCWRIEKVGGQWVVDTQAEGFEATKYEDDLPF